MPANTPTDLTRAPLGGIRVLDLSTSVTGFQASQVLADFGAEVVHVEPPGGSPLRDLPSYPCLARGKHSVAYRVRAEIPGTFSALPTKVWRYRCWRRSASCCPFRSAATLRCPRSHRRIRSSFPSRRPVVKDRHSSSPSMYWESYL